MKPLLLNCEVLTPMFLAGNDNAFAELRAPSVKGMLRYWWRTVQGSPPDQLFRREAEIFGAGGKNARRSRVTIRIRGELNGHVSKEQFGSRETAPYQWIQVSSSRASRPFKINILEYLAYGTYAYSRDIRANVFVREYIKPGCSFTVELDITKESFCREVHLATACLALFGGLGSRSRNSFGSVQILNPEVLTLASEVAADFSPRSLFLHLPVCADLMPYSSFNQQAVLFATRQAYQRSDECHAALGIVYRNCRGRLEPKHIYEKRQYIGSPIIEGRRQASFLDRRAKPYHMSIFREESGRYRGYILYLPSAYCQGIENNRLPREADDKTYDAKFNQYCQELNELLAGEMDEINPNKEQLRQGGD